MFGTRNGEYYISKQNFDYAIAREDIGDADYILMTKYMDPCIPPASTESVLLMKETDKADCFDYVLIEEIKTDKRRVYEYREDGDEVLLVSWDSGLLSYEEFRLSPDDFKKRFSILGKVIEVRTIIDSTQLKLKYRRRKEFER